MDWLNLHTSTLDSPEFIGSDTKERGTWLSLLRYCIGQENGGCISDCRSWKDRQWQQLGRVTRFEVARDCRLFHWSDDALIVWGYPIEKEQEVTQKREVARVNGKKGGRPKLAINNPAITNVGYFGKPTLVESPKAEGEGEWKEKEKEKSAAIATPVFPADLDTPAFAVAWADWLAYRRERRLSALKPRSIATKLAEMATWGEPAAIAAIRDSIGNNWQGIFPPKAGPSSQFNRAGRAELGGALMR